MVKYSCRDVIKLLPRLNHTLWNEMLQELYNKRIPLFDLCTKWHHQTDNLSRENHTHWVISGPNMRTGGVPLGVPHSIARLHKEGNVAEANHLFRSTVAQIRGMKNQHRNARTVYARAAQYEAIKLYCDSIEGTALTVLSPG